MSENKYHIKIARDETRTMGRAERLWYKGTAKWFLLFGLIVLAGVGTTLAFLSLRSDPVPKVSGARITNPVVQNTAPHFYVKVEKGNAKTSQDGKTWNAVKSGATLISGDSLQTQEETYVTLLSNQNSVVRLAPNSQIMVNDVSAPSAKIFQANVKLIRGQAWTHLAAADDEKVVYTISTNNFLANAGSGVFDVESGATQRISAISGKLDVKQISEATNSDSVLKDSITSEYSLDAGKSIVYKSSGKSEPSATTSSLENSYWWKWNREEDADYERSLKNKVSDAGPPLELNENQAVVAITDPIYEVSGRSSLDARIFVNNFEVTNQDGSFAHKISVPENLKTPFPVNIFAIDRLGNQTVKTFSLSLSSDSENAPVPVVTSGGVALNLSAESIVGGIELVWNSFSGSPTFDGYHLVRSESNQSLSYPKNEQFAEIADAKTANYLDATVSDGSSYYYRVCVRSAEDRYDCSNVFGIRYKKPASENTGPSGAH